MNNCVAINITSNGELLNKNSIPILFYWDGKSNVKDEIISSDDFTNYINSIITCNNYNSALISYFYFTETNDRQELYNENTILIQDIFTLDKLNEDVVFGYVLDISKKLYSKSFKSAYVNDTETIKDSVLSIYKSIMTKYTAKISKMTYIEYIRTELSDKTLNLSTENINYIINTLFKTF